MRPMSSSAGLRTSRPSTPWASVALIIVTDGGGAGSFGAAGAAFSCCWDDGGAFASPSPHECAPYRLTVIAAANASKLLTRILFPRLKPDSPASPSRDQDRKSTRL